MLHDICENSVIHVVLTCISSLVRQYTRTTNRSCFRMISSDMCTVHGNDRVTKLAVLSGHSSQVFHVDFFLSFYLSSFNVSDCPSCIHCRRDPRVGFSEKVTSRK